MVRNYSDRIMGALRKIHHWGMTFGTMSAEDILVSSHLEITSTVIFTSMCDANWWGEESQDPMKEEAEQLNIKQLKNILIQARARPHWKRVKSS